MALSIFNRNPDVTQQEKEIIKNVSDNEIFLQMMGNVKLSTPGLASFAQAKRNQKNAKKNANRNNNNNE